MQYKILIISAALLAAPVAFARDHGDNVMFMRAPGAFATTTPDGRPLPPPVLIRFNATTTNAIPVRLHMASSTGPVFFEARFDGEGRGEGMHEGGIRVRMIGSTTSQMGTTSEMHATSTMPRPGVPGLFLGIFKRFFGGPHDNGNSSTTPPQMRGELNGHASTTVDAEASTTPRTPPAAVVEFFQNFFSRFFH